MTVNLDTLPGLFAEIGEKADHGDLKILVRVLAARCALFAGVVGKMAEHIAALEAKIEKSAPTTEAKPEVKPEEETAEPSNDDLDAEVMAMAAKMNGGKPVEIVEAAVQKGAL